jgi:hypothetical protein
MEPNPIVVPAVDDNDNDSGEIDGMNDGQGD